MPTVWGRRQPTSIGASNILEFECPKLEHVREAHPEAVLILRDVRPDGVYIPIAQSHDDLYNPSSCLSPYVAKAV